MKIRIEKNIYVRDKNKVRRQAFTAGQEVDQYEYDAVLSTNAVINPQDLPVKPTANKRSLATDRRSIATKDLAVEPVEVVVRSEESIKEAEAEVEPEVVEEVKPVVKEVASTVAEKPKKAKAKVKDE